MKSTKTIQAKKERERLENLLVQRLQEGVTGEFNLAIIKNASSKKILKKK